MLESDPDDRRSTRGAEGPLTGLRVADFSRVLAGPYATMLMADLGADVIKIEPPQGDDTRQWLPPAGPDGRATYFASANRNKRSIALDLTSDDDRTQAFELAASADVVVENFRPGVMAKFGLDYPALAQVNPSLVMCSITGFGSGAGAALPGYDLLVQAMGGLMSITGHQDHEPSKVGVALVDVVTGLHALNAIQAALLERHRSGQGQYVEVNLLSSLLSSLVNQASATLGTGVAPARTGNAHPSIAPYEPLATAEGELVLAVGNDRQFQRLTTVLGSPELAADLRFATNAQRVANRPALRAALERLLAAHPADHWSSQLLAVGVPAGRINSISEALTLAESLALHPVIEIRKGERVSPQVANPVTYSRTPVVYELPPPDLDEHQGAWWRAGDS